MFTGVLGKTRNDSENGPQFGDLCAPQDCPTSLVNKTSESIFLGRGRLFARNFYGTRKSPEDEQNAAFQTSPWHPRDVAGEGCGKPTPSHLMSLLHCCASYMSSSQLIDSHIIYMYILLLIFVRFYSSLIMVGHLCPVTQCRNFRRSQGWKKPPGPSQTISIFRELVNA